MVPQNVTIPVPSLKTAGVIHIIGIGGIGMSGIAEILHNLGCKVQGSDIAESANVERLRGLGIRVAVGHKAENIDGASVVVKSTAVQEDNPEVAEALGRQVMLIRRSEMLAEIMRLSSAVAIAGTHGKTTTTTMMATLFDAAGTDPTVINGGIINAYGTNARLGKSPWLVVEADESDGTFIQIPATIGVVTNIDPEHMEYYKSFDVLKEAFRNFILRLPFYGFGVVCKDHPVVAEVAASIRQRQVLTYGIDAKDVDARATNISHDVTGSTFNVTFSDRIKGGKRTLKNVKLAMPGRHNVLNSLAAFAVGAQLGFDDKVLQNAFSGFQGVKRRFTKVGEAGGVTVIDDYGHHPTEIAATLHTAKEVQEGTKGKVIAVVQPHRYTRLKSLFKEFSTCFGDADKVVVADVYPAGEKPIAGIDKEHLVAAIEKQGHEGAIALESADRLAKTIHSLVKPGDLIVCLGAGSITYWANALPNELGRIAEQGKKA